MRAQVTKAADPAASTATAFADISGKVCAVTTAKLDRRPIRAVMFFADDPETCGRWWAERLTGGAAVQVDGAFCWFDLDGVEVAFHHADPDRNPRGGSPVVYWTATDVLAQREEFLDAGCTQHRGPLDVAPGRRICQLVDPFGNVFGLDGP